MPSPCYSARAYEISTLIFHTTQGADTIEALGGYFANGANQVSSHHGADNYQRNTLGAYVMEQYAAWTSAGGNGYGVQIELCGYAEWSRDKWLNEKGILLDNAAGWLSWMAVKYGIPLRLLSDADAQNPYVKGVCQHVDLGSMGGGHWDCGSGFPIDVVMGKAANGPQETGGITVAGIAFDSSGRPWEVGIWEGNGQVNVKVGDSPWTAIDKGQTGAKAGPSIAYDPEGNRMRVVYVNKHNNMACYTTNVSPIIWGFDNLGGNFQG